MKMACLYTYTYHMFTKRKTLHQKRDSLTVIRSSTSEPKSYVLFIMHLSIHTQHIHGVYVGVCVSEFWLVFWHQIFQHKAGTWDNFCYPRKRQLWYRSRYTLKQHKRTTILFHYKTVSKSINVKRFYMFVSVQCSNGMLCGVTCSAKVKLFSCIV